MFSRTLQADEGCCSGTEDHYKIQWKSILGWHKMDLGYLEEVPMAGEGRGLEDLGTDNCGKQKDKGIKGRKWFMGWSGYILCLIRDICCVFPLTSFLTLNLGEEFFDLCV